MGIIDGEHIVTSITHGFYGGKDHEKQCYLGLEPFFMEWIWELLNMAGNIF